MKEATRNSIYFVLQSVTFFSDIFYNLQSSELDVILNS